MNKNKSMDVKTFECKLQKIKDSHSKNALMSEKEVIEYLEKNE